MGSGDCTEDCDRAWFVKGFRGESCDLAKIIECDQRKTKLFSTKEAQPS